MLGHAIFDLPFLANSMATLSPSYPVQNGPTVYPYELGTAGSLIMWMDAGTIVANDGDPVTTWNNHPSASLPNVSMSQATSEWKPIYKASGIGGLPSLAFSSSGYGIGGLPSNAFNTFAAKNNTFVMICQLTSSRPGGHIQYIFADTPNGIDWQWILNTSDSDYGELSNPGVLFPDSSTKLSASIDFPPFMMTWVGITTGTLMYWYENQYARGNRIVYFGALPTRFMYGPSSQTPGNGYSTGSISEVMFWSGSSLSQADVTNLFTNYVMKKYPSAGFYQA